MGARVRLTAATKCAYRELMKPLRTATSNVSRGLICKRVQKRIIVEQLASRCVGRNE